MAHLRKWILAALVIYNCLALVANVYVKFIDPTYDAEMQIDFRAQIIGYALINLTLLVALAFSGHPHTGT